ncbi:membrane protein, partial [Streptomyces sp. e14]
MASSAGVPAARLRDRARGALLGLAVGDALGAPAENLKPSEIRARWGRITGYVAERPAGTDDTEYALFSGLLLARHGSALTPAHVEAAWHEHIADRAEGPFRGAGFSERGTLENLRRGLAAPVSAQHRHAWSDGLAMRAAPFGVFAAGRPAEAARLVAIDGSVSHEGEGIHGGRAVAAGVAAAMAGAAPVAVVAAALAVVPDDSWTARTLRRATAAARRGERAVRSAVVIGGYPWADLAPEAVAPGVRRLRRRRRRLPRRRPHRGQHGPRRRHHGRRRGRAGRCDAGVSAVPEEWAAAIGPARGSCLPSMAGRHVLDVADLLLTAAETERRAAGEPRVVGRTARRRRARRRRTARTRWRTVRRPRRLRPHRRRRRRGRGGRVSGPRRIEGLLLGLAAGDAAGWPAARHRAARMPEWTRRLTRELDTFAEQNATTTLPVPIALNQPPGPLRLGPSDDAEWAAFAAEAVLRAGDDDALGDLSRDRRVRAAIDLTWNTVAAEVAAAADRAPEIESAVLPLRARISVRDGLGNLPTGLRPPATGHDNPHYFR